MLLLLLPFQTKKIAGGWASKSMSHTVLVTLSVFHVICSSMAEISRSVHEKER